MRLFARLLVAMVFFSQALVAAHACAPAARSANFAAAAQESACHEEQTGSAVSCLTHCSTADQSLDTPQVTVAAMPVAALLTVPTAAEASAIGVDPDAPTASGADPPVRFQVFRS